MNKKGKILLAIFAVLIFSAMIVGMIAIVPKNDNDNGSNVQKEYTISYFTNGGQGQIQSMHVKAKKNCCFKPRKRVFKNWLYTFFLEHKS